MKTEWKDVPGVEGVQASSTGKLRKYVLMKHRRQYLRCNITKNTGGYLVCFKGRPWPAHILVGKAWVSNPDNLPFINHKNGNKKDNRPENLEWCTTSYNTSHAIYELGHRTNFGLKPVNIYFNRKLIKACRSVQQAARYLNCKSSQVSRVCSGERSHYDGYRIEYAETC
jgi:hypothetical protein